MRKPRCYLLRFDDLCPSLNWTVWDQIEELLIANDARPLLAIVPNNRDPTLQWGFWAPNFWERARQWQARGWTIALHGYQHLYVTRDRGLVGRRALSEFAGLPWQEQRSKLVRGIAILRAEGLEPTVWVAPGHTFDATTVQVLQEVGIATISDGFWIWPHLDERGVFWIPQQLWGLRPVPRGIWTVCYHINNWGRADLGQFAAEIRNYHDCLTDVPEIRRQYGERTARWWERRLCRSRLSYWIIRVRLAVHSGLGGGHQAQFLRRCEGTRH